jgi:hypothetical protein
MGAKVPDLAFGLHFLALEQSVIQPTFILPPTRIRRSKYGMIGGT